MCVTLNPPHSDEVKNLPTQDLGAGGQPGRGWQIYFPHPRSPPQKKNIGCIKTQLQNHLVMDLSYPYMVLLHPVSLTSEIVSYKHVI